MPRSTPTFIYHFTRVEHLASIVGSGLVCDRRAQTTGLLSIEIGNQGIKERRLCRPVPVEPGGSVGDYVPFYFAPRSPMMYSIYRGNVPGYSEGTGRLVYLVASLEKVRDLALSVVLSDRNAVLSLASFVCFDGQNLAEDFIDWPLMKAVMWNSTEEDPDRMERRMAECLVYGSVPWQAFLGVVARTDEVAAEARAVLGKGPPKVYVRSDWYF